MGPIHVRIEAFPDDVQRQGGDGHTVGLLFEAETDEVDVREQPAETGDRGEDEDSGIEAEFAEMTEVHKSL